MLHMLPLFLQPWSEDWVVEKKIDGGIIAILNLQRSLWMSPTFL